MYFSITKNMGIEPTCISYEPNMENEPTNIWMLLAKQSTENRKTVLVSQNEDASIDICFGPLKFPQKLQWYEGRQWLRHKSMRFSQRRRSRLMTRLPTCDDKKWRCGKLAICGLAEFPRRFGSDSGLMASLPKGGIRRL